MNFDDFLRKASLYKKSALDEPLGMFGPESKVRAIHEFCAVCKEDRTFNVLARDTLHQFDDEVRVPRGGSTAILRSSIHILVYQCAYCSTHRRFYFVHLDPHETTALKVGQFPAWSIDIPKQFEAMLREHNATYKKGLICES